MQNTIYCPICRKNVDVSGLAADAAIGASLHEKSHLAEALARIAWTSDDDLTASGTAGKLRAVARSALLP